MTTCKLHGWSNHPVVIQHPRKVTRAYYNLEIEHKVLTKQQWFGKRMKKKNPLVQTTATLGIAASTSYVLTLLYWGCERANGLGGGWRES